MPLLGLFSKKTSSNKSQTNSLHSTTSAEAPHSPTADYVVTPKEIPSSPNGRDTLHPSHAYTPNSSPHKSVYPSVVAAGASSSTSRLRLPFTRKKNGKSVKSHDDDEDLSLAPPARPSFSALRASDTDIVGRNLTPPKLQYSDPHGAHSTRSLPTTTKPELSLSTEGLNYQLNLDLSTSPTSTNTSTTNGGTKQRPSIFPWTKSQPNTTSKGTGEKTKKVGKGKEKEQAIEDPPSESSFNLKSFRHVNQPSPTSSPYTHSSTPSPHQSPPTPNQRKSPYLNPSYNNAKTPSPSHSSSSLAPPPPLPRPRNASVGSTDSGQRISVAAFREAQARRSLAGSPVFDARPDVGARGRSPSPGPNRGLGQNSRSQSQVNLVSSKRASRAFTAPYSDSDEDESEEEEDDSDDEGGGLSRKRTVRARYGARSESGHSVVGGNGMRRGTKSELGHGSYTSGAASGHTQQPSTSSSRTIGAHSQPVKPTASSTSVSADDSSDDDTPLGVLLPPRRPGSALSSRSNSSLNNLPHPPSSYAPPPVPAIDPQYQQQEDRQRTISTGPAKRAPLIDISTLTGPNRRPLQVGGEEKKKDGFTGGDTLLSGGSGNRSMSPEKMRRQPGGGNGENIVASVRTMSPTSFVSSDRGERGIRGEREPSLTSTLPPNGKFISPPSSPVGSVFSSGSGGTSAKSNNSAMHGRKSPMRKDTADVLSVASAISSRSGGTLQMPPPPVPLPLPSPVRNTMPVNVPSPEQEVVPSPVSGKRDVLSDRLKGVVASKMSTPTPPIAQPQPKKTHARLPADDDSDEDESEEEEDSEDDEVIYGRPDNAPAKKGGLVAQTKSPSPVASATASPALRPQQPASSPPLPPKSYSPVPPPKSVSPVPVSESRSTAQPITKPQRQPYRPSPQPVQEKQNRRESTELDLASVLGGGIRLISFDGDDGDPLPPSPTEAGEQTATREDPRPSSPGRIAPIVVKERERTPAFSVTSRPKHKTSASVDMLRSSVGSSNFGLEGTDAGDSSKTTAAIVSAWKGTREENERPRQRPRSTTLGSMPSMTLLSDNDARESTNSPAPPPKIELAPQPKPAPPLKMKTSSQSTTPSEQQQKPRGRGFGLGGLLSTSRSSSALGSNASASGSSSVSAAPSASSASSGNSGKVEPTSQMNSTLKPSDRQRGSTMPLPGPTPAASGGPSMKPAMSAPTSMYTKPFASQMQNARASPASSTGGSSSGRVPVTPRDGSDIGVGRKGMQYKDGGGSAGGSASGSSDHHPQHRKEWSGGASGLGLGGKHGHARKRSVAFDEDESEKGKSRDKEDDESRRKERRRGEAKAAIELGNVINGRGPIVDDDDDDLPISQQSNARMAPMNPMMMPGGQMFPGPFGAMAGGWPSPQSTGPQFQLLSPTQFVVPPPTDPSFLAAHQQAMMYAKQAYQMAVAQQAMAAAAEEWERGSAIGFSSSQSMYGGPSGTMSMYGGMGGGNGWSTGSVIFPSPTGPGPRTSMFGMSGARSEYGGPTASGGGGWGSSQSVYGMPTSQSQERTRTQSNFASSNRTTFMEGGRQFVPPPIPQQKTSSSPRGNPGNPRSRTVSQPANPSPSRGTGGQRKAAPPSSWKQG
ncbi:hypothetical protein VNI00_004624 [Paramarasmius palmivorus]|uniref:Uncharacterized protein n=1 Tax=Paramarasmius palmivorus TaxID=297713 RepID=A0AAW0DJM3_9AGAR